MGRAGVRLGANQSNIHYFRTKTRHTHKKIPWSSQKMQIVLLACLDAALVLVPAANAQGCKPGTSDASAKGKGGAQKKLGKANSLEECAAMVIQQVPDANGATWRTASKPKKMKNLCYAEKKQDRQVSNSKFQNCYIKKVGEPCDSKVEKIDIHTNKKKNWKWLDEAGFCAVNDDETLTFWVKAAHDAFITLSNDKASKEVMEVALGVWLDTSSSIRERQGQSPGKAKKGGGRLDKSLYRPFWIRWKNNNIIVGEGSTPGSNVFMQTTIDQDVFYIGVSTGSGAEGDWAFGYDPTNGGTTTGGDGDSTDGGDGDDGDDRDGDGGDTYLETPCMRDSYPDQQSIGASCNSAGNADVDACKKVCLDDDKCQALDWNHSASWQNCRCWIHTNEVALQELKDNANVDQWRKFKPCPLD